MRVESLTYVLVFKDEIRICVVPQILGFSSLPPALKLEGGQGLNFLKRRLCVLCHEKDDVVPVPTLSGVCGRFGGYEGCCSLRGLAEEGGTVPP